jgi:PAS domain S-box-containing protein
MLQAEKVILESRAALEVSTRLLTDILESLGDGFFAMDRKWVVQYFNSKAEELTGKKREEMIGRVFWDIYPSAVYTLAYTEYHRALRENTPVRFEMYSGLFNDWFEVSAYPSAVGLSVYFRNITVKKRIQEEVRRLSLVAEHTVNSVVITDAEERITWVNQAFCRISGYTAQEVIGQRPGELLQGPETSEKAKAYLRRQIANREPFKCDIVNYSKDGRPYWVEIMGQPLFNEQGELEQFFAIQTDITERIELQRLVIEEKIDAQKEMSKAIIEAQERERSEIGKELHDNVNQVLTTVKLYIENIRDYPEMQEAFLEKSVTLAQRAINEIRFLSKQLVTPVMNDLGFRATLDELVTHYRSLNRFELLLHFTICEEKLQHGAKLNIYRIIQEQLNNIVKYAKASMVTIRILFESGAVYLSIEDNGVGFDPSVTAGGIGMNNIRNRAEVYKGVVQVHAAPGTGCRLEIRFPAEAISRC